MNYANATLPAAPREIKDNIRQRLMSANEKIAQIIDAQDNFHDRFKGIVNAPKAETKGLSGPRGIEEEVSILEAQIARLFEQQSRLHDIA